MMTEAEEGVRTLCTFSVDGLLFGIDVRVVQEVMQQQAITPVPLAPQDIQGLINLRGQIVTAIDLRHRLGLPVAPKDLRSSNVLVWTEEGPVSLVVDDIGDVVTVDESSFDPPPENLRPESRALIHGVYKTEPRLLLMLDAELAARVQIRSNNQAA